MKQICKHIETGRTGIIIDNLKGTDRFPDQYGIFWLGSCNIKEAVLHYWQNKSDIELI